MGRTSDARERILSAARSLIETHGYSALGVAEICRTAGVPKGSFYYFFDSKESLALAVIDDAGRPGVVDAAATNLSCAAAGPRSPPTMPRRTHGGSPAAPFPGSTTRTQRTSAADHGPRSTRTRERSAAPTVWAADPEPASPSANPSRPRETWPASHKQSCGAAPVPQRSPPDGPRPGPAPPHASAAPQASDDPVSGRRYRAHPHRARSHHQSRPTYELRSNP